MKCPKLSKEFGDAFRFLPTSIPTAAEAAEVDVRADRRLGGILPYREKSVVARNTKIKLTNTSSFSHLLIYLEVTASQGQLLEIL